MMNSTILKQSFLVLRHIQRQIVQFKSSRTLNNVPPSQQIPAEKSNTAFKMDKSEQSLRNTHQVNHLNNGNKDKPDSVVSSFLFSNKNDPDSFGSLSEDWKMHEQLKSMPDEEDDVVEREFLFNKEGKTKLTINQYGRMIKKFINQNKIALALDVMETRMLKIDKVKPDNYIYNLLIGACGQVGYSKKAFNLFKKMRDRGLKITGHTYTGLFNACANSPYPEDGLKRARHLQGLMLEKGVLMNPTIYHAMIKAFGRCGDLETSFMLVDEMVENRIMVSNETFNFLLHACITDKTSGFRHALLVWHKMMEKRVRPDMFSFNLLLRCSRDCGLGDELATQQVIQLLLHSGQRGTTKLAVSASHEDKSEESQLSLVPSSVESGSLPNLIARKPTLGSVTAVTNITLPEHKLMLMGGSKGILEQMNIFRIKPNIKTFTQLMEQLPPCSEEEQALVEAAKRANVPLDVDFFNMLIRKRCFRKDYESAKDVLKMIHADNLRPTIMTFGVLAMACRNSSSIKQLLQDINNVGYRPNVEILGTLLKNACYTRNCGLVKEIMKTLEKEDIKPNEMFLKHLNNFYSFVTTALDNNMSDKPQMQQQFIEFCQYYEAWRQEVQPEVLPKPWAQFQEPHLDPEDVELMNTGYVKYAK